MESGYIILCERISKRIYFYGHCFGFKEHVFKNISLVARLTQFTTHQPRTTYKIKITIFRFLDGPISLPGKTGYVSDQTKC